MVVAQGETQTTTVDAAQVKTDQTSSGTAGSTSPTPKTYTEAEHKKGISDALAEVGRKHKTEIEPIIRERDTFKSQAEQANNAVKEATATAEMTQSKLTELEGDLETLSDENATAAELAKIRKRIDATEIQLRKDLKVKQDSLDELTKSATKEREQWASTVAEYQAAQFEVDLFEVAETFEGGDAQRLKTLCEKTGKKSREDITDLASVLWTKKAENKEPALINDSSVTNGGGGRSKTDIQRDYASSKINMGQYIKEMTARGFRID